MLNASVILCTRNRAASLADTLRAVLATTDAELRSQCCELIVVDNGSTDHTAAVFDDHCGGRPNVRRLWEPRPGKGHAYNAAIAAARGRVLLFTDDDVRPPADWVRTMARPILDGEADAVQGGVRIAPDLLRPWMRPMHRAWLASTDALDPRAPEGLVGANMAIGRHVFDRIGGFDVALGPGGLGFADETLLAQQMRVAGFRIAGALGCAVEHHFDADRLAPRAMRRRAVGQGRSDAYIAHHWAHSPAPARTPVRLGREAVVAIVGLLGRLANRPPSVRELAYAASAAYRREMARLAGTPRRYARHGLTLLRSAEAGTAMTPMDVLFLLPDNFIGGGVFAVYEHARRLAAAGHSATVAFAEPTADPRISTYAGMEHVAVHRLADVSRGRTFDVAFATAWQTAYQVRQVPARAYGYFVQDDERRFFAPPNNRVERWLAGQTYADDFHFVASTRWLADMLRAEFGRHAAVVPYGTDVGRFRSASPTFERTGRLRVLVEGRGSEPRKRVGLAFDVLAAVGGVDVFYVSADGVRDPRWAADRFLPKVPHADMPGVYRSCDVLLKLSSQESFGLPVLEMFAAGGTAVVSAYTGHDQLAHDHVNALVVPVDDRSAAVAALTKLRDDPALLARLREAARASADRYDWSATSGLMVEATADILRRPPGQTLRRVRRYEPLFRHRYLPGALLQSLRRRFGRVAASTPSDR